MKELFFPEMNPEALGIPSSAVSAFVNDLNQLEQSHAFVLMRHGKIAARGAWSPYTMELPHELFSLSKSFVSCAIGIAQGENRLKISDRVMDFFPEYLSDRVSPEMKTVTLKNLLTMSSGHDRCSFNFVDFEHGDWLRGIFESPLFYRPGERFVYNSGATFLLAAVIRKVTGMNVSEYLQSRLFDPLEIQPPEWNCNPQGTNIGGWGLWLNVMDIAKFAHLLLHRGCWNGRQLVPAEYLAEATSYQADNSMNESPDWKIGYGYQFWRCREGGFRGDGAAGQYAVVYPEKDLTLAFVSGMGGMQQVLTSLQERILPVLKEQPLPENPAASAQLRTPLENLRAALPPDMSAGVAGTPECAAGEYAAAPNRWGIQNIKLSFGNDSCSLDIDGVHVLAGFRETEYSNAALAARTPHRVAARAAWLRPDLLKIYAWCIQTTARFTWLLRFDTDHVVIQRTTPILFFSNENNIVFHAFRTKKD